jgi:hypothetical protein
VQRVEVLELRAVAGGLGVVGNVEEVIAGGSDGKCGSTSCEGNDNRCQLTVSDPRLHPFSVDPLREVGSEM